ncbi:MAG TPA: homoserine kinase [Desertimonas sp.]|nr:homoserine kinase [Desertimonas sp.]
MTVVRVPASSANLGPGFDALGVALDVYAEMGIVAESTDRQALTKRVDEHHPAWIAFHAAGGRGEVWVRSPIPIGRGLGFSGAMRVGGAARAVVQRGGSEALAERHAEVLAITADLEGHADNVAASLYGGVVATAGTHAVRIDTPLRPDVVLWIPEETTLTAASRTALPASVSFEDAVFNVGRSSLLVAALAGGDIAALSEATQDRLHQQRRLVAVPASGAALDAGIAAGAWCGWLSGSGPTVAFLTGAGEGATLVAGLPTGGGARVVAIDQHGTTLVD